MLAMVTKNMHNPADALQPALYTSHAVGVDRRNIAFLTATTHLTSPVKTIDLPSKCVEFYYKGLSDVIQSVSIWRYSTATV